MNRYDEYFDFSMATVDDVDDIMRFIREEWNVNHILGHDREFFLWQYGNEQYGDDHTINVVLMRDKKGELVGFMGFVAYAPEGAERNVSSAMAKVKSDLDIPMCGVELIRRYRTLANAHVYYSSGTNPRTMLPIGQKVFHYSTGMLQQYYMLNTELESYKIAKISHQVKFDAVSSDISLCEVYNFDDLKYDFEQRFDGQGYKCAEFMKKRYFNHPVYHYRALSLNENNKCVGVLFTRVLDANGARMLRIADYIGDLRNLARIGVQLRNIMTDNEYEFIDLQVGTLSEGFMSKSGFVLRTENDDNIIPTYFEPFEQKNVNVWYQKSDPDIVIFKADGDQDRPNNRMQ